MSKRISPFAGWSAFLAWSILVGSVAYTQVPMQTPGLPLLLGLGFVLTLFLTLFLIGFGSESKDLLAEARAAKDDATRAMAKEGHPHSREFPTDAWLAISSLLTSNRPFRQTAEKISALLPQFFPGAIGALYLYHPGNENLQLYFSIGTSMIGENVVHPSDCTSFSKGKIVGLVHQASDAPGQPCRHFRHFDEGFSVCAPVVGMSDFLGILSLHRSSEIQGDDNQDLDDWLQRARLLVSVLGLHLANLNLQGKFEMHSIRDPLTGMFNRRYLEESLLREIAGCTRRLVPIGIILVSSDHMAQIRAEHGDHACDQIYWELGQRLPRYIRTEDIPCRYDANVLCVLLPGASLQITQGRAEKIRSEIEGLEIGFQDAILHTTLSVGVAVLPDHAQTAKGLVSEAEKAMMLARQMGGNRVVVSPGS